MSDVELEEQNEPKELKDQDLKDWLLRLTAQLRAAGQADARHQLMLLLAQQLGMSRSELILNWETLSLDQAARKNFEAKALRLAHGEPLAYVLGEADFYGQRFKVTPDVLIPRPDTEILLEVFATLPQQKSLEQGSILDIGTGSGIILISAAHVLNAKQRTNWDFVGTDESALALEVAKDNAKMLLPETKFYFEQADLWPHGRKETFDFIFSNPPYIDGKTYEALDKSVRAYEPKMALYGGDDGLDFYRRIIAGLDTWLVAGGLVLLEIGYDQAETVSSMLKLKGYTEVKVFKDYGHRDRVVMARRPEVDQ